MGAVAAHLVILSYALAPRGSQLFFDSDVTTADRAGCDFYALYVAGYNLRHGQSVYDERDDLTPCRYSFRYLPVAAALGVPFSFLAPVTAYRLWLVMIELSVTAGLYCTWILSQRKLDAFAPLAVVWLCASPVYLELRLGQYSLLQAALVMIAATAARTGASKSFTASLAASLCFKLNSWLALPSVLRARKFLPLFLAAIILLVTSVPHFLTFPSSLQDFLSNLRVEGVAADQGFTRGNLGLSMLIGAIMDNSFTPAMVQIVFLSCFAAGCAATLYKSRMDLSEQLVFWLALSLLAYKHTWEHHYVMALPALTFLGLRARGVAFWIVAALIVLPTPYYFFIGDWLPWRTLVYHAWKPTALTILLIRMTLPKTG